MDRSYRVDGYACPQCGWEWTGQKEPTDAGQCGAHVGGEPCRTPLAFAEYKRHAEAGCNHAEEDCKVPS